MNLNLDRCEVECSGQGDPFKLANAIHRQMPPSDGHVPVEEIALALDIMEITDQPFVGIEAVLQTDACKSAGSIGVKAGTRLTRRRFSIAHELGHFLNEKHEPSTDGRFACTDMDMANPFGEQRHVRQEREANVFAIELLTPRDRLAPILKRTAEMERALSIAGKFGISREAALRRYVDLHSETLAVAFSSLGRIRYIYRSKSFPWVRLKKDDLIGEAPHDVHSGDNVTSMDEVDPETWLEKRTGHQLFAQTLIQSAGFAATLLVLEAREEDEVDEPRFR